MRITIYGWKAPVCKCGCKMEIYADLPTKALWAKCICCGFERHVFIPFYVGDLTLRDVYDIAHSLTE